jgi:hypothetical protein
MIKQNQNKPKRSELVSKSQVKQMIKSIAVDKNLMKFIDTQVILNTTTSTPLITNLNMPTTGTGSSQINGANLTIDHFEVHMSDFFLDSITTSAQSLFDRFLLYQNNTESPIVASGDLLDQTTTTIDSFNSPLSYSNNGTLFKPILNYLVSLDSFNTTDQKVWMRLAPKIKKLKFNPTDGAWSNGVPAILQTRYTVGVSGGSAAIQQITVRMWYYDV